MRDSCASTHAAQSLESSRHAKQLHQPRFLAQSRRRPDQDRLQRRAGSLGRGICHSCLRGHAIDGLLYVLPNVLAGVGLSSGLAMNFVASRCARRRASGDHAQTKPLTLRAPSNPTRPGLRLRRAAGARTPLVPARDRPTRWPGLGQHGWELHARIALALAISVGSKSIALGCVSQILAAPDPLPPS
ncbi:hypothetical protein ACVWW6_009114 [Bradyrhizobium sp. USDA 3311]